MAECLRAERWQLLNINVIFNPLRAIFSRENINLHFMSFFHIDMTQEVEILPQIR